MTDAPAVAYLGLDHHHCEPYLESLAALPATVTCAYEPDESVAVPGQLADVTVYRDLDRLLDETEPKIAWITASNRDTPALLGRVVDAGLDAFVEKPMACTAAGLAPVVDRLGTADPLVVPSYPWRAHPIAGELRRRADEGFFGELEGVSARFFAAAIRHREPDHYIYDAAASRGGIVQWLGVHWLDLVPWMLESEIEAVQARTSSGDLVDVEAGATVTFELADGTLGSLECGYTMEDGRYDTEIAIRGTGGRASWDPMGETFGFTGETSVTLASEADTWAAAPRRTRTYEYAAGPGYGGRWGLSFMERFLEARRGETDPPATIEDALTVLSVLDAIYEAAETGSRTPVRQS